MNGTFLCTGSIDKSLKIFDVINFDMINMIKLNFLPLCVEWIHVPNDAISVLAVSDAETSNVSIFDAQGGGRPLHVFEKLHSKPVTAIKFNVRHQVVVSVDKAGMLEYWTGPKSDYKFPSKVISFSSKMDTDLYEFAKNKTIVTGLTFSNDGQRMATISTDRKVRIFNFRTGKLKRVFDEGLSRYQEKQQTSQAIPNMEFGRRLYLNFRWSYYT